MDTNFECFAFKGFHRGIRVIWSSNSRVGSSNSRVGSFNSLNGLLSPPCREAGPPCREAGYWARLRRGRDLIGIVMVKWESMGFG